MKHFIFALLNWFSEKLFVLREDKLSRLQDKVDGMAGKYDPYSDAPRQMNGSSRR
jgi:hypothetical protein